jgi:mRNA export factor
VRSLSRRSGNFAFKCHRDGNNVYAVNAISFHMQHGTFATCGSDGYYHFWDKDNRSRLQAFEKRSAPVVVGSFSPNGNIFAYALSYDWSKGVHGYNQNNKTSLYLHPVSESEVKKKDQQAGNRGRGR